MEKILSEDYCTYEISRLLEEKGFHAPDLHGLDSSQGHLWVKVTHQMAMKWLREVHKLFIVIEPEYFEAGRVIAYDFSVWCGDNYKHYFKDYPTFEEAVEAAIKYSLENLIQ